MYFIGQFKFYTSLVRNNSSISGKTATNQQLHHCHFHAKLSLPNDCLANNALIHSPYAFYVVIFCPIVSFCSLTMPSGRRIRNTIPKDYNIVFILHLC